MMTSNRILFQEVRANDGSLQGRAAQSPAQPAAPDGRSRKAAPPAAPRTGAPDAPGGAMPPRDRRASHESAMSSGHTLSSAEGFSGSATTWAYDPLSAGLLSVDSTLMVHSDVLPSVSVSGPVAAAATAALGGRAPQGAAPPGGACGGSDGPMITSAPCNILPGAGAGLAGAASASAPLPQLPPAAAAALARAGSGAPTSGPLPRAPAASAKHRHLRSNGYRRMWAAVCAPKGERDGAAGAAWREVSVEDLIRAVQALPPAAPAGDAVRAGLAYLDSRAYAALLKGLAKAGMAHRAAELFDDVRCAARGRAGGGAWACGAHAGRGRQPGRSQSAECRPRAPVPAHTHPPHAPPLCPPLTPPIRRLDPTHELAHLADVYTYTTAISQCSSHHQLRRALELVAEMRARAVTLNVHTYRWGRPHRGAGCRPRPPPPPHALRSALAMLASAPLPTRRLPPSPHPARAPPVARCSTCASSATSSTSRWTSTARCWPRAARPTS
jgi:pentatricopeptide repeat protein